MSADNILVVIQHDASIRVFDINFSDISSHSQWCVKTPEAVAEITAYIANHYSRSEIWKSGPMPATEVKGHQRWLRVMMQKAEGKCQSYCRNNIVEYGWEVIPSWSQSSK